MTPRRRDGCVENVSLTCMPLIPVWRQHSDSKIPRLSFYERFVDNVLSGISRRRSVQSAWCRTCQLLECTSSLDRAASTLQINVQLGVGVGAVSVATASGAEHHRAAVDRTPMHLLEVHAGASP